MGKLRTLWTLILLAACAALAYQGYQNSRIPHPVDAQAEAVACEDLQACKGPTAQWSSIDASPFARMYFLDSSTGPITIECRWSAVLLGEVTCRADREEIVPTVQEKPERLPHETQRGVKK